MPYAKIHIENLGPIREGTFELRPLTIFIGPNNSGKTYAATAAYALVNGLRIDPHLSLDEFSPSDDGVSALQQVLVGQLLRSISNAFAVQDLDSLRRGSGGSPGQLRIDIDGGDGSSVAVHVGTDSATAAVAEVADDVMVRLRTEISDRDTSFGRELCMLAWSDRVGDLGVPLAGATYLPPGRDGLIVSLPLLATLSIGLLRQDKGAVRKGVLPLRGIVLDYLERLLASDQGNNPVIYPNAFVPAVSLLEQNVLGGSVERERRAIGLPAFVYRFAEERIPLENASSMVADMASLSLWIKEQLAPDTLFIVDEPEAHLHPANERRVAQVLGRLASAGVRVLIPTHSSTIVHQIGNIVRSQYLSEGERRDLGFTDDDRLTHDQVGLYQFRPSLEGVVIEEIPYDPEFGYAEEGFYEVAEALHDESVEIDARMPVPVG